MLKLVCFILDDDRDFPVDIDENKTVGDLKDEIKKKNAQIFANVDAWALTLYRIDVDVPADINKYNNIIGKMSRGDYMFKQKDMLISSLEMSHYFQKDSKRKIEVLVEHPQGEPIISRACGDTRLQVPRLEIK
jgi:hypothetical protein